jgi:hypothetical protein
MKNAYRVEDCADQSMKLRRFEWTIDNKNNAVLTWDWPQSRLVKLMFIFWHDDESLDIPEVDELVNGGDSHEVVTRDLSSQFTAAIPSGKRKYIAVPGYFNEDKGVTVCKTAYVTDWLFKKVTLTATAMCKPLPLSQFQKIVLRVSASDTSQMPLVCQILKYAVYEQGRKVGEYPLDSLSMSGACGFFIKKEQAVRFILDENYSHLFNITR